MSPFQYNTISDVHTIHSCLRTDLDCGRGLGAKTGGFAWASHVFLSGNRRKRGRGVWDLPALITQP